MSTHQMRINLRPKRDNRRPDTRAGPATECFSQCAALEAAAVAIFSKYRFCGCL